MTNIFDAKDVVKGSQDQCYKDQLVIIKPEYFKPEYRSAEFQLFEAKGGFGCDPDKLGTAVFGQFCIDGETARVGRYDILGIATEEAVAAWKKLYKAAESEVAAG